MDARVKPGHDAESEAYARPVTFCAAVRWP